MISVSYLRFAPYLLWVTCRYAVAYFSMISTRAFIESLLSMLHRAETARVKNVRHGPGYVGTFHEARRDLHNH